jgi:hypothetical protein
MEDKIMKTGIRFLPKVANAIFEVEGNIAFVAKANTDASVNITMEKQEVVAGQNNAVLGTIFSDTKVEAAFTSVEWKPEFLAATIGSTIKVGKFDFKSDNLKLTSVENDGKIEITLPAIPSDKKIYIESKGSYIEVPATTVTVDVTAYGFDAGDCISLIGMFPRQGKRISIGTEQTPLIGRLTLSTPIFEGTKGRVGESQYVFDAFQFNGNFTQNFTSDSNYEMSGSAIASESGSCSEGEIYGSYQEYLNDESEITNYSTILSTPSVIELAPVGTQVITVYGIKNALYDRMLIEPSADLVFSIPSEGNTVATVTQDGKVSAVATGNTIVTATHKGKLISKVNVTVS